MNEARIPQRYDPAVDVELLLEHPENPRRGDVEAIDASMAANGFYGVVLVQESTGHIVAGNHRYRVAVERGATHIPVLWLDCDDDQGRRILAVDQRTAQMGGTDEQALAGLLAELETTDLGLDGSGYSPRELADLRAMLGEGPAELPDRDAGDDHHDPSLLWPQIDVTVPADAAEAWRVLLDRYEGPTDAARLRAHLLEQGALT